MAEREFAGRVALVTGGSRGIGRAICVRLAERGADVAVNYVANEAAARETAGLVEAAGRRALAVKADVSDQGAVAAMVAEVEAGLGAVDLLVANAGLGDTGDHAHIDYAQWRRLMDVNLDGVFLSVMAVKDAMLARGFGRIVCIASIAGLAPRPQLIAYATSKAGVIALVRNFAQGLAPAVRINAVAPGLTDTEMIANLDPAMRKRMVEATPMGRTGTPDEIAEATLFLLSERSSFSTGQTFVADGGRIILP